MHANIRIAASLAGILLAPVCLSAQTPSAPPPVTISGSVTSSFTSSNNASDRTIVGRLYGRNQNEFMFNVANLTLDRAAPTDRAGAGFHVETFFGQNAAVVKSTGLDLGPNADIWQAYATLNLPLSGAGRYLQFKAGKMATLLGIEVGEDVLNPNLEVGWQDVFLEPFTETGVELDAKFSARVDAELRVSNGWDQVTDVNTGKTLMARLGLTPNDKVLVAFVGYIGAEQPDSNGPKRTGVNALTTLKLRSTTTLSAQLDYGREEGIGPAGGDAAWTGAGVWLSQDLGSHATLALRGDYMKDRDGARTSGVLGFPVNSGQTLGSLVATLNIKYWDNALLRPEVRYDHSSLAVFNGNKQQVSIALGLSYIY